VALIFNPLNTQLNPICHLLALLGAHHILHGSRIRVNSLIEISSNPWEFLVFSALIMEVISLVEKVLITKDGDE